MSSLQIAEITGKNHADVMRDIRITLEQAEIGESKFAGTYRDVQNKSRPCYHLPRRECDLVISGYSVKYRLAIIDRWQELESKQAFQLPQSFPEALRLLAAAEEEKSELAGKLALAAPKAEALDLITGSDSTLNITNAAKTLQVRPRDLFEILSAQQWIYRRAGSPEWIAYQQRIQQGVLTHRVMVQRMGDGEDRVRTQVLVTTKGLAVLAEQFAKNKPRYFTDGQYIWRFAGEESHMRGRRGPWTRSGTNLENMADTLTEIPAEQGER